VNQRGARGGLTDRWEFWANSWDADVWQRKLLKEGNAKKKMGQDGKPRPVPGGRCRRTPSTESRPARCRLQVDGSGRHGCDSTCQFQVPAFVCSSLRESPSPFRRRSKPRGNGWHAPHRWRSVQRLRWGRLRRSTHLRHQPQLIRIRDSELVVRGPRRRPVVRVRLCGNAHLGLVAYGGRGRLSERRSIARTPLRRLLHHALGGHQCRHTGLDTGQRYGDRGVAPTGARSFDYRPAACAR
jgi:hypothetical protein